MTEKKLVKKLAEVMKQVKYIQKKGFNKFNNYNYATESDVAEKVREVLAESFVIMIPNMTSHSVREHTNRKGFIEYIVTVNMEFRFIDGETGEELVFNMVGEGQDSGDKGTYKAVTGAQKYALMKVFMIPTGDDPEADNTVDERNNEPSKLSESKRTKTPESKRPMLLAKWKTLGGTAENFESWYQGQQGKGYNEIQMEQYLTQRLMAKNKENKGA